ncbi:MAG: hypothetical protein ACR2QS_00180 [Woeseiaceae bacterium]
MTPTILLSSSYAFPKALHESFDHGYYFIAAALGTPRLPTGNLGYVNLLGLVLIAPTTVLCAPLGAKLAHSFSPKRLSMLFGMFLLIAAGRLALA